MRAKRVDGNQAQIVKAIRAIGGTAVDLSGVGEGCPDLLVGYRGKTYLMELKRDDGKLTPRQVVWHREWRGDTVHIIRSPEIAVWFLTVGRGGMLPNTVKK